MLDHQSVLVEGTVVIARELSVIARRYHGGAALVGELLDQGVCIIALVGDERRRLELLYDSVGGLDIMDLAFGELDVRRVSKAINESMNLGGRASTRMSNTLGSVFFPPVAS